MFAAAHGDNSSFVLSSLSLEFSYHVHYCAGGGGIVPYIVLGTDYNYIITHL